MNAPEDQNGLREALARAEDAMRFARSEEAHERRRADNWRTRTRAAEAEITRLKEGMEGREKANDRLTEMVEKLVLNASVGRVPLAILYVARDLLDTLSQEQLHG